MAQDPFTRDIIKAAGGPTAVAAALGISFSAVMQWKRVPPRHMPKVAELAGRDMRAIRPDLFPLTKSAVSAEAA